MHIFLHLLPGLVSTRQLADQFVVVIDVLRATTTILAALDAGATAVVPCLTIRQARQLVQAAGGQRILGGERRGKKIPGFDLGNSPAEYTPAAVGGREIALTTTNGTRALYRCQQARQIALASFTNRSAIVDRIARHDTAHVLCAGTDGSVTMEDAWLAGSLLDELALRTGEFLMNDAGQLCLAAWRQQGGRNTTNDQLYKGLCQSQGGRNLVTLGFHEDLRYAASVDRSSNVPLYDSQVGRITLA
jgi:2-phosphosulfolactate phosphatase